MFIRSHKVLWKYAAAPMIVSTVVLGIGYGVAYWLFFRLMSPLAGGEWYWQVLYYLLAAMVTVLLLMTIFFVFTFVSTAIASPFNELISEKTEILVKGAFCDTPFSLVGLLRDSGRSIIHSLAVMGIYVGTLLLSLPLLLIPGLGELLFAGVGVLLSSYLLAFEFLGFPMDRRHYSFTAKCRFLHSSPRSTLGFGLGNAVVATIPLVNILLLPAAAVGGTLLFLEIDTARVACSRLTRPL
jgi:CysZ protein